MSEARQWSDRGDLGASDARAVGASRVGPLDVKRVSDVVVSAAALVLTSPVLAATTLAVRLDSPGPVLFRQVRVGRHGRPFTILKFRTMRVAEPGAAGANVSASGDPRVTRVGRVLRASKLDELPQLVNVLRGEMSLVGPRPEVPEYARLWTPAQREIILSVRPGLTDEVSISGIDEAAELARAADPETYYVEVVFPRKAAQYVQEVHTATWRSDLVVLGRTALAVVRRGGARGRDADQGSHPLDDLGG